ncbi:MAG: hypothetical protein JWN44_3858 [Myxococcales bacterium]|nr:hypothetical protein [Myxococcales bacterium]
MESHALILRRVGAALLAYFALHLFSMVFDYATDTTHSFSVDLLSLVLSLLLLQGHLGAARWIAFFTSARLAATALGVVALPLVMVWLPEVRSELALDATWVWGAGAVALNVAFDVWRLRERSDAPVEDARAVTRRGSIRGAIYWGAGLCIVVTLLGGTLFGLVYAAYRRHLPR